ncbi:hypothetical protein BKA62DRAFT_305622 [Auriculariales sp. MPI-PUGE-AT-0066]|nr:hypothetical protein BKA62DRAFT_305622 [Auriculariales sp. MPI-PUGE-AT-0066]
MHVLVRTLATFGPTSLALVCPSRPVAPASLQANYPARANPYIPASVTCCITPRRVPAQCTQHHALHSRPHQWWPPSMPSTSSRKSPTTYQPLPPRGDKPTHPPSTSLSSS